MLRLLALHRRFYQFISTVTHIPGDTNSMADDASRLWNLYDTELLANFNLDYPQARSWKLAALRPQMNSALISSLYKRRSTMGLFPQEPEQTKSASGNGKSSDENKILTHSSIKYGTRSRFSKFFTRRVRSGLLAHNGEPVCSRTSEAYLRAVGQTFANLGIEDPRLNKHGSVDHRLQ